jgi:hypothetical protein
VAPEMTTTLQESAKVVVVNSKMLQKHSFVKGGSASSNKYWQCLQCCMVPFEFRAPGALFFLCPSVDALQQHSSNCQKDGMYLGLVKMALKELMAHHGGDSLLVKDTCLQLVRLVVGDDEELTRLFTTTTTSVEAATSTSGLWRRLPHTLEFNKVQEAFQVLAKKDLDLSSSLLHPKWVRFLQLISPCLQCPTEEEKGEDENKVAEDRDETLPSQEKDKEGVVDNKVASEGSGKHHNDNAVEEGKNPPSNSATKMDVTQSHQETEESSKPMEGAQTEETNMPSAIAGVNQADINTALQSETPVSLDPPSNSTAMDIDKADGIEFPI